MNDRIKYIVKAIVTPFYFSKETGHFKSAVGKRAVNKNGDAIPMLTYPVVDLLESKLSALKTKKVLEWGSGQSSIWWADKCLKLVAIERNPEWAAYVADKLELSKVINGYTRFVRKGVELIATDTKESAANIVDSLDDNFDVILIDANPRIDAAEESLRVLSPDGVIIVDNSDIKSIQPLFEYYAKQGFGRIDMYGFSPGAYYKQCTSILFKENGWFWKEPAHVPGCSPSSDNC